MIKLGLMCHFLPSCCLSSVFAKFPLCQRVCYMGWSKFDGAMQHFSICKIPLNSEINNKKYKNEVILDSKNCQCVAINIEG